MNAPTDVATASVARSSSLTSARAIEAVVAIAVRALAIAFPAIVWLGIARGGIASFAGVFVVFGLLSAVELALHSTNIGLHTKPNARDVTLVDRHPLAQLRTYAFGHLALYVCVFWRVTAHDLPLLELVGAGASLACIGGTVGGLGGHELFHKRGFDRWLGLSLYATAGYAHFASGHLAGHHANAGRRDDWGTARRGETIYAFIVRAVVDGFVGGWRFESVRLRRQGHSPWSPRNLVLASVIFDLAVLGALAIAGGFRAVVFFVLVSLATIAFMELFNYISHYALAQSGDDSTRGATSDFTWESNNKVVNWFIWNAGKHCHHHDKPGHGFHRLDLTHAKEYIPHGIALMAILSFVPPLYLSSMERILRRRSRCP